MSKARTARSLVIEAVVIVGSILLAFGIDAWWEERREQNDVLQSLEVVRRDLAEIQDQLVELEEFSAVVGTASLAAARALSGPGQVPPEDRYSVEQDLRQAISRRTMRLPRAGYTDLLSTGGLGLIEDLEVRDGLISFFERVEREEEIIEKNSNLFTDEALKDALVHTGLAVPYLIESEATELQNRRNQLLLQRMGDDFPMREARLWRTPQDSPEVDRLVATLFQNARGAATAEMLVADLNEAAGQVLERLEAYLAGSR